MFFQPGDYALLRLHHGYSIPSAKKKLGQQYVGHFKVIKKVGRLAYQLDIPTHWKVHPIFTIAQLEPAPHPTMNPFHRPRPEEPPSVFVEGDTDTMKSFELERILDKRMIRKGRGLATEYLVKWVGYGPEHDRWLNIKDLGNAKELVQDYEDAITAFKQHGNHLNPPGTAVSPLSIVSVLK